MTRRSIGRLELISFTTGFALLTFELAAARVLAPTIGSSTYVWTSVIGVIIAALALGFWIGGRLADMRDHRTDLVWLLLLASLTVVFTLLLYPGALTSIATIGADVRLQAVMAALMLFAPTSFLIGMTSPYLAKLNVRSLETTGQHIASLDAFNSLGGIMGTFLTGFVLFGYVGSRQTFAIVAILLMAVSWLITPTYRLWHRTVMSAVSLLIAVLPVTSAAAISIDTPSAHYNVIDFRSHGLPATGLTTGPTGIQSGVYKNGSKELVFWYTRQMAQLVLERQPKRILMMGGGAFTLPQYLAEQMPNSQIDVVEIDPELKPISERYFGYDNPTNVRLIFGDARTYLNQSSATYDMVLVDVYGNTSIPFTFMTREYAAALVARLTPSGIVLANVIAGQDNGPCQELLEAIDSAYRTQFSYGYYSTPTGAPTKHSNYVIAYSRQPMSISSMPLLPKTDQSAYSDNYAPAERLHSACQME